METRKELYDIHVPGKIRVRVFQNVVKIYMSAGVRKRFVKSSDDSVMPHWCRSLSLQRIIPFTWGIAGLVAGGSRCIPRIEGGSIVEALISKGVVVFDRVHVDGEREPPFQTILAAQKLFTNNVHHNRRNPPADEFAMLMSKMLVDGYRSLTVAMAKCWINRRHQPMDVYEFHLEPNGDVIACGPFGDRFKVCAWSYREKRGDVIAHPGPIRWAQIKTGQRAVIMRSIRRTYA